jgi:glycosyltransferase involved in cell wall biosynthesis
MAPTVSVIIPTYNRRPQLIAAIESVAKQTYGDWELIVVDDGSRDGTVDAIQPYLADSRVRYLPQENAGRSAARNSGARQARGEWLSFLDSDDLYLPATLAAHRSAVSQSPDVSVFFGGYEYVDDEGAWLGERRPWDECGLGLIDLLFNCPGLPGSTFIRRDWFERSHGFDSRLNMAEDWDLFLRLAQLGCPMGWTRANVCQYRQHPDNSIRSYAQHRDQSLLALNKVFQTPYLPVEISALAPHATAWVYVVFARRAFAIGHTESAVRDLKRALEIDPGLASERRSKLLETLFSPETVGLSSQLDMETAVAPFLPAALSGRASDIRRAQARVQMAAFFRAQRRGARELARTHLGAALRRDPRWLLNRGVLAFVLRQLFGQADPVRHPS